MYFCYFFVFCSIFPYGTKSYQRLGTKLLLGIMYINEIIVLTAAGYNYAYYSITNFRLGTVIVEITKDLVGIRCGCKCSFKSFKRLVAVLI